MDSPRKEEEPVNNSPESEKQEPMVDFPEAEEQKARRPLRLVLVGAQEVGLIGSTVYNLLRSTGHDVTVLTSDAVQHWWASVTPEPVIYREGMPLGPIMAGADALVSLMPSFYVAERRLFIQAAADARIPRLVAIEPGYNVRFCPSGSLRRAVAKRSIQNWLEEVESASGMAYTLIYTGICLDPGEQDASLVDIKEKYVCIYGDGNTGFGASVTSHIAQAIATALDKPEETRNRCLRIRSLVMNQNTLVRFVEACIGWHGWNREAMTMEELMESYFDPDDRENNLIETQEGVTKFTLICDNYGGAFGGRIDNELLGIVALDAPNAEGIMRSYIRYLVEPGFRLFPLVR